jgi:hypothetical protein
MFSAGESKFMLVVGGMSVDCWIASLRVRLELADLSRF